MDDLISRQAAIDMCRKPRMRNADCSDFEMEIMMLPSANCSEIPNSSDTISRQAAIDEMNGLPKWIDSDHGVCLDYSDVICVLGDTEKLPSAQPEQRYTEEELRVFKHGISLSLLSKRSAQHWRYDEDMATEIKFLERLYDKVVADMGGEQDG